jgi:hypothetical protein
MQLPKLDKDNGNTAEGTVESEKKAKESKRTEKEPTDSPTAGPMDTELSTARDKKLGLVLVDQRPAGRKTSCTSNG